jgi:hypothetical protein
MQPVDREPLLRDSVLSVQVFEPEAFDGCCAAWLGGMLETAAPHEAPGAQRLVGIAWGKTLNRVIAGLHPARHTPSGRTLFVPVQGSLGQNTNLSPTYLCQQACDLWDPARRHARALRLDTLPAIWPLVEVDGVPRGDVDRVLAEYWQAETPDWPAIFGPPEPALADQLGLLVTSVGGAEVTSAFTAKCSRVLGDSGRTLPADLAGDMAGILISASGEEEDRRHLDDLQARWTGLQPRHVRSLVARASAGKAAGSAAFVRAFGVTDADKSRSAASKGLAALLAVRQGLVSHLLVDTAVAETMQCWAKELGGGR